MENFCVKEFVLLWDLPRNNSIPNGQGKKNLKANLQGLGSSGPKPRTFKCCTKKHNRRRFYRNLIKKVLSV